MGRKLVIEIELGNDAFAEDPMFEITGIFRRGDFATRLDDAILGTPRKLMDINGNTVGSIRVEGR